MLIIENITVGTVDIDDLGLSLAPSETIDLTIEGSAQDVAASGLVSGNLYTQISDGNIVVKDPIDGVTNLSTALGIAAIRTHNDTHFRMPSGGRIADAIDVDLSAPGSYLRFTGTNFVRQTPTDLASAIEGSIDITATSGYIANQNIDWTVDQSPTQIDIANIPPIAKQNVFETVTGDTGSTTANAITDTLTVSGGTGISTAIVGDVLTISNTVTDTGITQLTGEVTAGSGNGAQAATITNDAVTNVKLANMAQSTFKGRAAGAGTGDPVDLTATQATAILNIFTATDKGLTPLSGGGTANFLRADGTWAVPTGGMVGAATAFTNIAVAGQSDIVSDTSSDTLTIVGGSGITLTTDAGTDTLTIASTVGAGSVDKRMNTWVALSGNLYYNDFVHNLGTTKVAVHLREFADNRQVEAEYTTIVDANTVRVVVNGNSEDIVTNVISGTGPTGATGAAGAGVATIQDEGVSLSGAATSLNFVGAGVVASGTGSTKVITIAGGTTGVVVQEEGSPLATNGTTLNFVGPNVTATGTGATKTITVAASSVSDDTSPTLGGELDLNDNSIVYAVPTADQTAVGRIISAQVDTNPVGYGAPLYMAADGNFDAADADFANQMPARVIALESGTGIKKLLLEGFIKNSGWNWTPGACVYVHTNVGTMTQTQPFGSGDQVQKIGFAWSATVVYFSPGDYTIVEVA